MRSFNSLGEFALHLLEVEAKITATLGVGLDRVLVTIEKTAKGEFGRYQPAVGPFPEWPELADSTKDQRVQLGFTENDPLLRSGEQRDSISHQRQGLEGAVGSTEERAVWSEFGTATEPARPVLGPAAFLNKEAIQKLVGAALVAGLIGEDQIHAALGYDFETGD